MALAGFMVGGGGPSASAYGQDTCGEALGKVSDMGDRALRAKSSGHCAQLSDHCVPAVFGSCTHTGFGLQRNGSTGVHGLEIKQKRALSLPSPRILLLIPYPVATRFEPALPTF